jgi:hypothetical protein
MPAQAAQDFHESITARDVWTDDHHSGGDRQRFDQMAAENHAPDELRGLRIQSDKTLDEFTDLSEKFTGRAVGTALRRERQFAQNAEVDLRWDVATAIVEHGLPNSFACSIPKDELGMSILLCADQVDERAIGEEFAKSWNNWSCDLWEGELGKIGHVAFALITAIISVAGGPK